MEERQIQIRINNSYSNSFTPEQGLPQGSPLSPLLYNIYCHDLYDTNQGINPHQYILQFADDTALIAHANSLKQTIENLQELMNTTLTWFHQWRLHPNPTKSQFIIFHHNIKDNSPTIKIANLEIQPKVSAKYLGIIIDNKMNFNQHTSNIKKRTIARAKHFRNLTFKDQGISRTTATRIYKSICRPLLEYGHTMFLNLRKTALKNLEVAETTSIRIITKTRHTRNPLHNPSNQLLYNITQIQPISNRLIQLSQKFASKQHNIDRLQPLCTQRTIHQKQNPPYRFPTRTILEQLQEMNNQ